MALALAMLLVASGCGARWSDSQQAAVAARGQGTLGAANGAATSATGTPGAIGAAGAATTGATGGASATSGGGATSGGAGDAAAGGTGAAGPSGPKPCEAPSDAPGVTSDTITVGNISSLTGPIPGLGASAVGATRAYIAYLNANGGVCGRKVEMKTADDGVDNGQFRSIVTQMGPTVLGLVGQDGGGDAGGADIVEQQGIPAVTTAFSTVFQNASTVFDINPPFTDTSKSIGKYRWLYDQGVRKAAIVYIAVDQSRDQIDNTERPLMEAAGIQVVNYQPLPLSTLSYDSAARAVANSGADYLLFLGGYSQNSSMATAMGGTGYALKVAEYFTAYGTNFIDLAGSAGEGAVSWSFGIPIEEASTVPEAAKFAQWLGQVAPDVTADVFADEAWASSKAFFDALEQLPGPISRQALIDQLKTFTSYDADGFYGRVNLGQKSNDGCYIAMHVVNGAWKRLTPDQGFLC